MCTAGLLKQCNQLLLENRHWITSLYGNSPCLKEKSTCSQFNRAVQTSGRHVWPWSWQRRPRRLGKRVDLHHINTPAWCFWLSSFTFDLVPVDEPDADSIFFSIIITVRSQHGTVVSCCEGYSLFSSAATWTSVSGHTRNSGPDYI